MSTVSRDTTTVRLPRDADGCLVPALLPVAAYLCAEEYGDPARSAALEALAAGRRPIVCALLGLIGWGDVAPIEGILGRRPPYPGRVAPIRGGAPAAAEAWPSWTDDWRWVPTDPDAGSGPAAGLAGPYQPGEEDDRWLSAEYGDQADEADVRAEEADDFPRGYSPDEYRRALRELVADHVDSRPAAPAGRGGA